MMVSENALLFSNNPGVSCVRKVPVELIDYTRFGEECACEPRCIRIHLRNISLFRCIYVHLVPSRVIHPTLSFVRVIRKVCLFWLCFKKPLHFSPSIQLMALSFDDVISSKHVNSIDLLQSNTFILCWLFHIFVHYLFHLPIRIPIPIPIPLHSLVQKLSGLPVISVGTVPNGASIRQMKTNFPCNSLYPAVMVFFCMLLLCQKLCILLHTSGHKALWHTQTGEHTNRQTHKQINTTI